MKSLSEKYILVDDWGRPLLQSKMYGFRECKECLTTFMKRNTKQEFCCRNCASNFYQREARQRRITKKIGK